MHRPRFVEALLRLRHASAPVPLGPSLTSAQFANIHQTVRKYFRPTEPQPSYQNDELRRKVERLQGTTPEQTNRLQTLATGYLMESGAIANPVVPDIATLEVLQAETNQLGKVLRRKIDELPPDRQAIARRWLLDDPCW